MTTPSTEELQRLLDEATPGEWEYREELHCPCMADQDVADALGTSYPEDLFKRPGCSEARAENYSCHTQLTITGKEDGVWAHNPPYHEVNPGDMKLAALAPVLAAEVIRLREGIESLAGVCLTRARNFDEKNYRPDVAGHRSIAKRLIHTLEGDQA